MHFLTQSTLLQALGWSLFNSLWQMGLCWLVYRAVILLGRNISADARHRLALLLLGAGAIGSVITFIGALSSGVAEIKVAGWTGGWMLGWGKALPYCSVLYLLVLGILLTRYSNQYLYTRKLRRTGLSKPGPELRVFVQETGRRLGIPRPVKVWLSSLVNVPMTLGFWRPVILLPLAMISNLTPSQAEAVLLHELAHIRRHDYLLNLGVTVLELLFFFNPFTRQLIADLRKEREHRCDDCVLQFRYDPHAYVSALLSLATQQQRPILALAATGGSDDRLLLQRARRILQQQYKDERPGARSIVLLLLTLALALTGLFQTHRTAARTTSQLATITPATSRTAATNRTAPRLATLRELYSVNIINTTPTATATASAKPETPATKPPHKKEATVVEDIDLYEEEAPPAILTSGTDQTPISQTNLVQVAPLINRSYSIGNGTVSVGGATTTTGGWNIQQEGQPFVPNSSYSYWYMEDTTRPEERLAYLQQLTEREIEAAVKRMQQELQVQLQLLGQKHAGEGVEETKFRQQIIGEQLKLQQQYLQKFKELQTRLKKAGHRVTVYI